MFKNRALQVQVVKKSDATVDSTPRKDADWTPEKINKIVKEQVRNLAVVVTVAYGAMTVLDTLSEIAVNNTKPKNKK